MSALHRAVRKLLALPAGERTLLVEAALLLPVVHTIQQLVPFRRWRPWLTQIQLHRPIRRPPPDPERIAQAVGRAQRGVPGVYKCLPAAYTTHLLLRRHGYASTIQVGVARDADGKVEAHAWVEWQGRILVGELPDLARFVPLPPLPL
jgi:hypothetical protein